MDKPISWNQYFMGIAKISSFRSKDPVTKVGACIVSKNNYVLAMGYNGMPRGCVDENMPWGKTSSNALENKYLYVCHAELNAILNSEGRNLKNSIMFVTLFPCCECAKAIIQVGISCVIYDEIKNEETASIVASKKMFNMAGVKLVKYNNEKTKLEILI